MVCLIVLYLAKVLEGSIFAEQFLLLLDGQVLLFGLLTTPVLYDFPKVVELLLCLAHLGLLLGRSPGRVNIDLSARLRLDPAADFCHKLLPM